MKKEGSTSRECLISWETVPDVRTEVRKSESHKLWSWSFSMHTCVYLMMSRVNGKGYKDVTVQRDQIGQ